MAPDTVGDTAEAWAYAQSKGNTTRIITAAPPRLRTLTWDQDNRLQLVQDGSGPATRSRAPRARCRCTIWSR